MTSRKTSGGQYLARVLAILFPYIHAAECIFRFDTGALFKKFLCVTLRLNKSLPYTATLLYILLFAAAADSFPQSRYTHYGAAEGLSQLNVRSIVQDKQGFLWAGTWDGLNRFDGYNFLTFHHDFTDSSSIANSNILSLGTDQDDRIWVLFPDGRINVYDKRTRRFRLLKYPDGSPLLSAAIHTPKQDTSGYLWTGLNDTIRRIDPVTLQITSYAAKKVDFPEASVRPSLVMADRNKIYIIDTLLEKYVITTGFDYYSLFVTSDKRIFLTTQKGELKEYDYRNRTIRTLAVFTTAKGTSAILNTLHEDKNGNLWAGTSEGLFICENFRSLTGKVSFKNFSYASPSGKVSEPVYAVFTDDSDVLWIGTISGLYKVNPVRKTFSFLPAAKNYRDLFGDSYPISMLSLEDGRMLTGTTNGLYMYNPANETSYQFTPQNSGYAGHAAFCIYKAPDGGIWVGTRRGLNRYDTRTGRFKEYIFSSGGEPFSYKNRIYAVTASEDGRFWAGSAGGLFEFSPKDGSFLVHTFKSGIVSESKSYILSLLAEGDTLWAGTNGEGLLKISLRDMSYKRFSAQADNPTSLSWNKVMAIHRDRKGRLWAATMGGGLNLLSADEKSFRRFTTKEGLSNNTVYGILEDNSGDLWVSTNAGLSRINGSDYTISVFGRNDLPDITEFNQNSYYKSPDGRLFFGGMRGIISFRPEEIKGNPHLPRIAITDFLLFNKSRPDMLGAPEIRLKYNQNFFSFELAALLYDHPGSNQYAYRLKGLHDEWIYTGTRRNIDFSSVEPGEYIFAAKAANEDGLWSEEQELARIVIVPPFWRTGWFYAVITLLVASAIILSARYYIRKKYKERIAGLEKEKLILEERNKTRDRIARDLHDDLASTVSSAGLYLQSAKQILPENKDAALQFLEKSTSILNKAEQSMSDIVWSVSPNYDSVDNLLLRIRLIAHEMCSSAGIRTEFISSGSGSGSVSEEIRRNIYLAAKEAVSNAVRHSSCTRITLTAKISSEAISLTIQDDGKGFSGSGNNASLGGNGLQNIKKRMSEINGSAQFVSEPSGGTSVMLSAPFASETK
ncbi:MAG: ATP-binding protein [Ignavibacteriales bacterium]|nr:MAG: ATP-binding protein [Ignavibacteriales bacterium]